jgi:multimeric flavodoxin WrbA
MENAGHYAEHIEDHINRQFDTGCRKCPHYSCTDQDFSKKDLRDHLDAIHGIVLP